MKNYKIFFIMLINILLQGTLLQQFRIHGIMPNTNLILIVIFSILLGRKEGIIAAVIGGFFQDLLFGRAMGINILIYLIIAYLVSSIERKVFKENVITPLILFILSTLSYHLLYFIIFYFFRYQFSFIDVVTNIVGVEMIYNIIVGLLMYKIALNRTLYTY